LIFPALMHCTLVGPGCTFTWSLSVEAKQRGAHYCSDLRAFGPNQFSYAVAMGYDKALTFSVHAQSRY
jgi:hypothetical protein